MTEKPDGLVFGRAPEVFIPVDFPDEQIQARPPETGRRGGIPVPTMLRDTSESWAESEEVDDGKPDDPDAIRRVLTSLRKVFAAADPPPEGITERMIAAARAENTNRDGRSST